jgi:hypothetical protein
VARERRQDDRGHTAILTFVEGVQYNQTGRKRIFDRTKRFYNEFFQLVWHAGIDYVGMRLESTGNFHPERSKK